MQRQGLGHIIPFTAIASTVRALRAIAMPEESGGSNH